MTSRTVEAHTAWRFYRDTQAPDEVQPRSLGQRRSSRTTAKQDFLAGYLARTDDLARLQLYESLQQEYVNQQVRIIDLERTLKSYDMDSRDVAKLRLHESLQQAYVKQQARIVELQAEASELTKSLRLVLAPPDESVL